jgi:hypothetical protein
MLELTNPDSDYSRDDVPAVPLVSAIGARLMRGAPDELVHHRERPNGVSSCSVKSHRIGLSPQLRLMAHLLGQQRQADVVDLALDELAEVFEIAIRCRCDATYLPHTSPF